MTVFVSLLYAAIFIRLFLPCCLWIASIRLISSGESGTIVMFSFMRFSFVERGLTEMPFATAQERTTWPVVEFLAIS